MNFAVVVVNLFQLTATARRQGAIFLAECV